jgi:hypothetical protein
MNKSMCEKNIKDEWDPTANRFVAYIDIMGFKDMVAKLKHEEIYNIMKRINERRKFNEKIIWLGEDKKLVRTTFYSDSIMIYSKDKSVDSFHELAIVVSAFTSDLFTEGIPHKGAIAFGEMTLDNDKSIFFGQPLIDAYLLQEELYFYGIIIHASAEKEIEKNPDSDGKRFTKNYLCPLKPNGNANHLTIFPLYSQDNSESEILLLSIKKLRFNTSGILRKYIDNTESYLNFVKKELKQ